MEFLLELIKKNGDKLVNYKNCKMGKKYMSVFNYSEFYGGTFDGFKFYNDYVVEIKDVHLNRGVKIC